MVYRLPPLSTLRVFETAARHLSFKRAAAELNVTPSAVSQQVRKLETYLDLALFARLPTGLQLSPQGFALLAGVQDGLACFVAAIENTRAIGPQQLTISAPPNFAASWLAPRISRLSAAYPDAAIRVVGDRTHIDGPQTERIRAQHCVDPRQDGDEITIRFGHGTYAGCASERILVPEYLLVCNPARLRATPPLRSLADLAHQVLIHDEAIEAEDKNANWREWLRLAGVKGVDSGRGPRYSDSLLVHAAVLADQGLALVMRQHVEPDLAAGRLVAPFPIRLPSTCAYYLVVPDSDTAKPFAKVFRNWLRAEIAASDRHENADPS